MTKKAVRHPQPSATSCATRKDRPTPSEKLDVYRVMARDQSPAGKPVSQRLKARHVGAGKADTGQRTDAARTRNPCANSPNSSVASPLKMEPASRTCRASIRSVSVASTGTAHM